MATIDDKVVSISFESSKFEQGVQKTLDALKKLQDALRFPEAGKNLSAVSAAAKEIDLGHIHKGIDTVSSKLGALRLTAIAVFSQIATRAVAAGAQMLKALTVQPLIEGYREYETQINAVQTILANTQAAGTGIKDVNKALDQLNTYADKTIYNFGQMTRNIGTFTAAGVDLKTSVSSIKGIANLAAVSGSNAQQASTAMYQLSQAISSGTVKLMDWNSVVNAGMGGTVFQRALAQTAEHMGTLKKGAVELSGPMKTVRINGESFRNSLAAPPGKEGWLSSKVLTSTLKQLSGDMTDAQLKAEGYTDAQIKAIQAQAKMALEAATQVKTFSQLMTTTKEALGSGWAQTWRIVVGDFAEAKKLWTGISQTIGDIISASANARNKMLGDWKKLGGRTVLISAIKDVFQALGDVLKPIGKAFRDIFPATTGKQLYNLTVQFKEFTKTLAPSPETINLLRRTFRGLFAILDIGKQILGGIFTVFGEVFGQISEGSGGFLEFTARIGDWLVELDNALKKGKSLNKFFEGLGKVISAPIKFLQRLVSAFSELFSGGASAGIDAMSGSMSIFAKAMEAVGGVIDKVLDQLGELGSIFRPIAEAWVSLLQQLPSLIGQALSHMSWEPILAVIRTGLLGGMFLMLRKFLGKGAFSSQLGAVLGKTFAGLGGGILRNINASFAALTGSLTALQQNLKAKTLKEIAIAVALLTVSMVALSFVDPKRLNSALGAITIAFGQLLGAMAILGNVSKSLGFIKMPVIATTLIILAGAIFTLSASVMLLSRLSWEELAKGLTAVGVMLGALVLAAGPLSAASFGLVKAGIGLQAIAVGLNILALAVLAFGKMDLMTLGKGLSSIGLGLFIVSTYIKMFPKGPTMILQGAGLIAIATALNILALAVLALGKMSLETLGKGLGAIGVGLALIAGAMKLMPKTIALQAAGLVLVAVALNGIATAIRILGTMSLADLAKGLGGLGIALGILAGGLVIISKFGTGGALALAATAAALAVLIPAIVLLGHQNIKTIAIGLGALAVALGLIIAAGILMEAAAPGLLAFGAAVALVGIGLAAAGAGIGLAAAGIAALVAAVVVAAGTIPKAMQDVIKAMIENAKLLALGVLEIVQAFADTAPQFVESIVKIVNSVIDALIQIVPKLDELVQVLLTHLIAILDQQQGPIVEAIIGLIMTIVTGIRDHIGEFTVVVLEIIRNFLLAIARNIGKIAKAGADIIIALIRGIAGNYVRIVAAALGIITRFLNTIANNLGKIVTAGGNIVVKFLQGIARNITRIARAGTDVIVAWINAIGNQGPRIITAATNTIIKFMNALQQNSNKLLNAGADAIIKFLNGVAKTIESREPELIQAGARIGAAIVKGMIKGMGSIAGELYNKAKEMVSNVKDKLEFWHSPPFAYGEYLGQSVVSGLAKGLSDTTEAVDAAASISTGVINTFNDIFETASPSRVMARIGRDVTKGFASGIKSGTQEDIRAAFGEMRRILAEQEAQIQKDLKRRDTLLAKKKLTKEEATELNRLTEAYGRHETVLRRVHDAQKYLNDGLKVTNAGLKESKNTLIAYANKLQQLNGYLETAKGIFQEFKDQYSTLPDFSFTDENGNPVEDQLGAYIKSLGDTVNSTEKYSATLATLKGMGLDDKTYEALVKAGPAAQKFADQLIKGGKPAIDAINALDTRLNTAATTLANNAAAELYDAGEQAAAGFVSGLTSQIEDLEKLMERIARRMIRALKKELGIKSPSEEFAKIGGLSMEGMAKGFKDSTDLVTDAADQSARDALMAMERSMRDISDVVTDQLDPNPVITPILDLSQVKAKQAELAALTATDAMTASVSSGQAAAISAGQARILSDQEVKAREMSMVKFEQNNYSPEALSNIEIYRQTKNQLSQIKAALALT